MSPSEAAIEGARVLVTGGAGFVGSNLVLALQASRADEIVVVDNLLSADRATLVDRATFVEGSIADDSVLDRVGVDFDCVFHLATYHGNQSSIADPLADHANNLITTLKLFERLKNAPRLRKFVYAASGCALAPHTFTDVEAVREDGPVPLDLDSPYQISKVVGEFYAVYYHHQHGLPTVRARFQNVYGPREVLGAGQWRGTPATVWRNVVPTFVYRGLRGWPLILDNGGRASRDFIYVADIVQGLVRCATRGVPGDVYNLASGVETTILELAQAVVRLTGNGSPIEVGSPREWDRSGRRFGSTEKARTTLDFVASTSLAVGLRETVAWTRAHRTTVDRCIAAHAARLPADSLPADFAA